eukprot:15430646-Alexandrium_andersonii.AAC.1
MFIKQNGIFISTMPRSARLRWRGLEGRTSCPVREALRVQCGGGWGAELVGDWRFRTREAANIVVDACDSRIVAG